MNERINPPNWKEPVYIEPVKPDKIAVKNCIKSIVKTSMYKCDVIKEIQKTYPNLSNDDALMLIDEVDDEWNPPQTIEK